MSHCKITNNSTERERIVYPFCFIKELFNKEEIGKIFDYTKALETEDSYVGGGDGGEGSYQVQVFFHCIDKNGPFYPEHQYDGRIYLGSGSKR